MNNIWNKRFPTYIALIVILMGLGITTYLVQSGIIVLTRASPSEEPLNIHISNITENSFTVSYTTTSPVTGALSYGKTKQLGSTALSKNTATAQETNHYITIDNLEPNTMYYFAITNGSNEYLNNGVPFEVKTPSSLSPSLSSKESIQGSILLQNGQPAVNAIVLIEGKDTQLLSTQADQNGQYTLLLNSLRNKSLSAYALLQPNDILSITVIGNGQQSKASFLADQTAIPTITLSNNYDFTIDTNPLAPEESGTTSAGLQVPDAENAIQKNNQIQITTPQANESFVDQRPVFQGKSLPNSTVTILIDSSPEITAQVTTTTNGNWTFRPTTPLPPGKQTITISSRDQFGILKTASQSFTIFAVGSQVSESATPSATPIITATRTPTPTLVPNVTATPTPTVTFSPTPTAVSSPTPTHAEPTPTSVAINPTVLPTKPPQIEPYGNPSFIGIAIGAVITTITGIILFFATAGGSTL